MRRITPLKRAIFESGRTQAAIARELEIDQAHLSRIVNGLHPSDDTKRAIADSLGRNVSELWPTENEERPAA